MESLSEKWTLLRGITRWCSERRGWRRVSEWVRQATVHRDEDYWVRDSLSDARMRVRLSDHIGSQIFWNGCYARAEIRAASSFLEADSVVVDVGANIGEFTLYCAAKSPRGRVIAFEPVPGLFEDLQENVAANEFRNVECVRLGLSDRRESRKLFVSVKKATDGTVNQGLGSFFRFEGSMESTIETAPLDQWSASSNLKRVDLMKLDVEGAEVLALKGAEQTIQSFRPVLILEADGECAQRAAYPLEELFTLLKSWRYRLCGVDQNGRLAGLNEAAPTRAVVGVPE